MYGSGVKSVKILYYPGKSNANADELSRSPQAPAPEEEVAEAEVQVDVIESSGGKCDDIICELLRTGPVVADLKPSHPNSSGETICF